MAKRSLLERESKRLILIEKFGTIRKELLKQLCKAELFDKKLSIYEKIQKLPRNSAKVRSRNRCAQTGRARGYFRYFNMSRHMLRELGHQGFIPGLTKSSW